MRQNIYRLDTKRVNLITNVYRRRYEIGENSLNFIYDSIILYLRSRLAIFYFKTEILKYFACYFSYIILAYINDTN